MVIDNEYPESFFDLVQKITCFPSLAPKTGMLAGSPLSPWRHDYALTLEAIQCSKVYFFGKLARLSCFLIGPCPCFWPIAAMSMRIEQKTHCGAKSCKKKFLAPRNVATTGPR